MLGYLRTITIGLLALLVVSSATVVPALAGPGHFIDWGDGLSDGF